MQRPAETEVLREVRISLDLSALYPAARPLWRSAGQTGLEASVKVFADRGCHGETCPENTLAAFQRAVDAAADGIETDIRVAADGVVLLFHDRCLADGTPVASLTRGELSDRLGYHVPTFAEALSQGWAVEWDLGISGST